LTVRFPPDAAFAPEGAPDRPAQRPPDLIDVFGVFAEAGADLTAAAAALYATRARTELPPPAAFLTAESAAARVLAAIAGYRRALAEAAARPGAADAVLS
jgi:hypothetical protein